PGLAPPPPCPPPPPATRPAKSNVLPPPPLPPASRAERALRGAETCKGEHSLPGDPNDREAGAAAPRRAAPVDVGPAGAGRDREGYRRAGRHGWQATPGAREK